VRRILVADDNQTLRHALRGMLSKREDWIVCGEAANGLQAVQLAAKLKPDAVLLDFKMPVMNGLEAAKEIIKYDPSMPIAMYTLVDQSVRFESEAQRIGVRKIISKADMFQSLVSSLDEMAAPKPRKKSRGE
jgi:DNA-binding NarL/FixJ family response regulator